MALAVPLSRFTPLVGGGSAFFVRPLANASETMKRVILAFITGFAFVCRGADPVAPFQTQSGQPPVVRHTTLDIRISAVTNIIAPISLQHTNDRTDTLALPIRIENRSHQVIMALITHEWYGGEWPPTDLGAAVRRVGDTSGKWRASEVYLVGELGSREAATVWQPGESHEFLLRLNWHGTGSVEGEPLIENGSPGKYAIKVSLVFKSDAGSEYFESPDIELTVNDKHHD